MSIVELRIVYACLSVLAFMIGSVTCFFEIHNDIITEDHFNRALSTDSVSTSNTEHHLNNGLTFKLLAFLILTVVFHPLGGSLIYGPCLRLWIAGPTSIILEFCCILIHLLVYYTRKFRLILHDDSQQTPLSLRQEIYCLLAARSANTYNGEGRRRLLHNDAKILKMIKISMENVYESWILRILGTIPIVTSYTVLMLTSGSNTVVLKVIGTLYAAHWFTLEILLLSSQIGDGSKTVARIKELMQPRIYDDDSLTDAYRAVGESTLCFERSIYLVHQLGLMICPVIFGVFLWPAHTVPVILTAVIPIAWLIRIGIHHDQRAHMLASALPNDLNYARAFRELSLGGPPVGPDIGCISFVYLVLYCIYIYDSEGTTRPDLAWLYWLGLE